jgi:hypothetical protein
MGETERRRRRLRPAAGLTPAEPVPVESLPVESLPVESLPVEEAGRGAVKDAHVGEVKQAVAGAVTSGVDDPVEPPARPTPGAPGVPGGVPARPTARPAAQADPRAARPAAQAGPRAARPVSNGNGRPAPPGSRPTSGAGTVGADRESERGLRGLVGSGSSQVSVGAALRARDAARATEEHLADAEANLTIVRRNWLPREDLPRNR